LKLVLMPTIPPFTLWQRAHIGSPSAWNRRNHSAGRLSDQMRQRLLRPNDTPRALARGADRKDLAESQVRKDIAVGTNAHRAQGIDLPELRAGFLRATSSLAKACFTLTGGRRCAQCPIRMRRSPKFAVSIFMQNSLSTGAIANN